MRIVRLSAVVLVATGAACFSSSSGAPGGGTDVPDGSEPDGAAPGPDATLDSATPSESGSDAPGAPEGGADGAPEATADAYMDGGDGGGPADARAEAPAEALADAPFDAPAEAGRDAGVDAEASVDGGGANLYVVDQNGGRAYAVPASASGATATLGFIPGQIAIRFDATLAYAYVANGPTGSSYIDEWDAPYALGVGAYVGRTTFGSDTIGNNSLAINHAGNLVVGLALGGGYYGVSIYPPNTPDASAAQQITPASTDLQSVGGLDVDALDNIYVADWYRGTVSVFAANASGAAAPMKTNTIAGVSQIGTLRFDRASGTLYLADFAGNAVRAYTVDSSGAMTLTRTIAGSSTGISHPYGLAVDPAGNLFVSNSNVSTVTVYGPGADGNQAPLRSITLSGVTGAFFVDLELGP